jgi:hypothetical protein
MIDWTRASKAELDTIGNALALYERALERQANDHANHAVRDNATWRLHVIEQLLAQIDAR